MTRVSLEGPAGPVPLQPAQRAPTAYVPAPHHIQSNHIRRRRAGMASRAAVRNRPDASNVFRLRGYILSPYILSSGVQVHPGRPELGTVRIRVGFHSGPGELIASDRLIQFIPCADPWHSAHRITAHHTAQYHPCPHTHMPAQY